MYYSVFGFGVPVDIERVKVGQSLPCNEGRTKVVFVGKMYLKMWQSEVFFEIFFEFLDAFCFVFGANGCDLVCGFELNWEVFLSFCGLALCC